MAEFVALEVEVPLATEGVYEQTNDLVQRETTLNYRRMLRQCRHVSV